MADARLRLFSWIRDAFALDTRSLGAFRIGFGLILLWDLLDRFPDISYHYTDLGLFPREILTDSFWNLGWQLSLHSLSGSEAWQTVLFITAAIAGLLFTIGWKTRWMTVICWVLLCSLHARNPAVLHGGDALMRMLLFFGMFLPLGARFSFDRHQTHLRSASILNTASFAFYIQVAAVYHFSLYFKTDPMWRETFDALYYTLSYDFVAKPFGAWLTQWPAPLKALTVGTVLIEAIGPLLLIASGRAPRLRMATIICFLIFHGAIWSTMAIGSFSAVCLVAWIAFLPSKTWEALGISSPSSPKTSIYGSRILQTIPALGIALILTWNASLLDKDSSAEALPAWLKASVRTPMLNQRWMAFSNENGLRYSDWLQIEGTTRSGERFDLLDGRNLADQPTPRSFHDRWGSERWRKGVRRTLSSKASPEDRHRLAEFYAERWNQAHPDHRLERVRTLMCVYWVNAPGVVPARGPLIEHVFFDTYLGTDAQKGD